MLWRRAYALGPLPRCATPCTAHMLRNRPGGNYMLRCPWSCCQSVKKRKDRADRVSAQHGGTSGSPFRCASLRCARTGRASQTPAARPRPWRRGAACITGRRHGSRARLPAEPRRLRPFRHAAGLCCPTPDHSAASEHVSGRAGRSMQGAPAACANAPAHSSAPPQVTGLARPGRAARARTGTAPTRRRTAPGCPARPRSRP